MSKFDHERETGKEYKSQDCYAGYYWGNHHYDSNELSGHLTDEQLKYSILGDLKKNNMMKSYMTIHVKEGMVILTGYMKTYTERHLIGQQHLNTHVAVKVFNDVQVTEPKSWSNQGLISEGELTNE
jgi:osmotically-inducible protein OsmY